MCLCLAVVSSLKENMIFRQAWAGIVSARDRFCGANAIQGRIRDKTTT